VNAVNLGSAPYSFPYTNGTTHRYYFTLFSGVRVVMFVPVPDAGSSGSTIIDYNHHGQVTCVACLFDGSNIQPATVGWYTSSASAAPSVVEVGTQYFNGATNSVSAYNSFQAIQCYNVV